MSFRYQIQDLLLPELQLVSPEAVVNDWLRSLHAAGRSIHTLYGYSQTARDYLAWVRQAGLPDDWTALTPEHLHGYRAHQRARGMTQTTIAGRESHLRALISWLVQREELPDDPWRHIPRTRPDEHLVAPPSLQEVQLVIDGAMAQWRRTRSWRELRNVALLALLFDTGLRASELLSLRVRDLSRDQIVVRGKGGRERIIAPSANVMTVLRRYLREHERQVGPLAPDDSIWRARGGRALTYERMWQIVQAAGRRAGVKLHPHLLRHGFATHFLMRSGGDTWSLQVLLGHRSDRMTRRYTATVHSLRALKAHEEHSPAKDLKVV
jgi:site-specific recombinase XerD